MSLPVDIKGTPVAIGDDDSFTTSGADESYESLRLTINSLESRLAFVSGALPIIKDSILDLSKTIEVEKASENRRGRAETATEIAKQIRAELVCCDIYEQVKNGLKTMTNMDHDICYWGEAAARIAEEVGRGEDE